MMLPAAKSELAKIRYRMSSPWLLPIERGTSRANRARRFKRLCRGAQLRDGAVVCPENR